ncbi:SDR family oxidoreductase [Streptomyces sp. NPDC055189]
MSPAGGLDTEIVVVGAGPVGLLLAAELRLGGASVTVLEQRLAPTTESRASVLHARTMDILDSAGLLERFGQLPGTPRGHFGGMPLDLRTPGPHAGLWKIPQTRTEELLEEWARELGAGIRRGHRLTSLTVRPEFVEVGSETGGGAGRLRAGYVVGCDGEHSTVRRLAGVAMAGQEARRELLRADVSGVHIPARRFTRSARGLANAAPGPDGITRVMVHEFGRPPGRQLTDGDFAEVGAAWQRVTGEDISAGTPLWVNSFTDVNLLADRYVAGRVLLAGDAAHRQMPVGGQALNLGLQDAFNLGWKLALRARGPADDGLLESYHEERHAVGLHTLGNIHAQAQLLLGGPESEGLRALWRELLDGEGEGNAGGDTRARLAGLISGQDTRYAHDPSGHPLVGRPVPHTRLVLASGETTTPAALLRSRRGLLLHLSADGSSGPAGREALDWSDRVMTVAATAPRGAPLADCGALLVRPDGHIAWAGDREGRSLPEVLRRWFGPPSARSAPAANPTGVRKPTSKPTSRPTSRPKRREGRMAQLTGRTALVTGSSRGMGRAIALRLASEDALVVVHCATGEEQAARTVERIEEEGGSAFAVAADLAAPGGVHELFLALEEGLTERTGSNGLDILVNNAGVMGGVKPEDTTPEEFDRLIAVNAKAPFFLIQRALRNMPDGGRIVNISSGLTRMANPQEIAYAMSKGALEQLALHFAKHLGPRGITVNSVAPGITRNDSPVFSMPEAVEQMAGMSAFNRVGEPEDIADVVAFLASPEARWVTGAFLDASGGTLLG